MRYWHLANILIDRQRAKGKMKNKKVESQVVNINKYENNFQDKYEDLEVKLGYVFSDKGLLQSALTHTSYFHQRVASGKPTKEGNERLEFLGDSILGFVVSDYIFRKYPSIPEGELTRQRALLICEKTLHSIAVSITLGQYLFLSKGEELTGGRQRQSILADAMEAIFGAVYLDGGILPVSQMIIKMLTPHIEIYFSGNYHADNKSRFQEMIQAIPGNQGLADIKYEMLHAEGPDHKKIFTVRLLYKAKEVGIGTGCSKKDAQQNAAREALLHFENL